MEPDFTGWASRNDLKCSDGRTIRDGAFAHQNGRKVPLVWQHQHNGPENVLGHAMLITRPEGTYTKAFFNDTASGKQAKRLVEHGDVESLSIYATKLQHKQGTRDVTHGDILEVSLVLSGANPGAYIDNVNLAHSADADPEDEAIIYTGEELQHGDNIDPEDDDSDDIPDESQKEENVMDPQDEEDLQHADGTAVLPKGKTLKDVYDGMDDDEKSVLEYLVGNALAEGEDSTAQHDSIDQGEILAHVGTAIKEGLTSMRNVFTAQEDADTTLQHKKSLKPEELATILNDVSNHNGSVGDSFLAHAAEYGIEDIDYLFPDAKTLSNSPDIISRRMEWVQGVLDGTKHSPFSRIKSVSADLTADEARAKGYVKGNLKKDEIIKLLKRVTTPTTVYKKQKLDRDDIIDITDIDVIAWLKAEMRVMLDEEIARAILVGDGRDADDEDKIDEDHLRPIAWDDDMYAAKINLVSDSTPSQTIEAILRARSQYKGSGNPIMYTTDDVLTDLILDKDSLGRRYYDTTASLAAALRVSDIVPVEAMEDTPDIIAIIVNLTDYTVGADKGGEISFFDDFDIDYNQQKYLIETRISGALTKPKSALVIKRAAGTVVTPNQPTYNASTHVITIPSVTGVIYSRAGQDLSAGNITISETTEIESRPAAHYSFPHSADTYWTFVF